MFSGLSIVHTQLQVLFHTLQTRSIIVGVLEKLVDPAWSGMKSGAQKAGEKIEPAIKQGLGPILKAKNTIKEKISSKYKRKQKITFSCEDVPANKSWN